MTDKSKELPLANDKAADLFMILAMGANAATKGNFVPVDTDEKSLREMRSRAAETTRQILNNAADLALAATQK